MGFSLQCWDICKYVNTSFHDTQCNMSTGLKYATNMYKHMIGKATYTLAVSFDRDKSITYSVLIERDGEPNHNLDFLSNQLALFTFFL